MCELDLFHKLRLYIPFMVIGYILTIGAALTICFGIARAREDVWIAGILLGIFSLPLFVVGLIVFCCLFYKESKNPKLQSQYPAFPRGLLPVHYASSNQPSEHPLISEASGSTYMNQEKEKRDPYQNMTPISESMDDKAKMMEDEEDYRDLEPL